VKHAIIKERLKMMKKLFLVCVILITCTSCSEFALLASGSSLAVSQNVYAKAYSGVDMMTIIGTEKDIKRHLYDTIKTNRSTKESD
jgi:hypothetical protein